jgi:hypothetical protein
MDRVERFPDGQVRVLVRAARGRDLAAPRNVQDDVHLEVVPLDL